MTVSCFRRDATGASSTAAVQTNLLASSTRRCENQTLSVATCHDRAYEWSRQLSSSSRLAMQRRSPATRRGCCLQTARLSLRHLRRQCSMSSMTCASACAQWTSWRHQQAASLQTWWTSGDCCCSDSGSDRGSWLHATSSDESAERTHECAAGQCIQRAQRCAIVSSARLPILLSKTCADISFLRSRNQCQFSTQLHEFCTHAAITVQDKICIFVLPNHVVSKRRCKCVMEKLVKNQFGLHPSAKVP